MLLRRTMVAGVAAGLVWQALSSSPVMGQAASRADAECSYDREALLRLDRRAFEENAGGWRALAEREGCMAAAADLIHDYRETHDLGAGMLYWHEGQLRAMLGATDIAVQLMRRSYDPSGTPLSQAWNLYAVATMAFLMQDKEALLGARQALAELSRPAGAPAAMHWPPNLHVVDMLVACFGQEYKTAYGHCKE